MEIVIPTLLLTLLLRWCIWSTLNPQKCYISYDLSVPPFISNWIWLHTMRTVTTITTGERSALGNKTPLCDIVSPTVSWKSTPFPFSYSWSQEKSYCTAPLLCLFLYRATACRQVLAQESLQSKTPQRETTEWEMEVKILRKNMQG